jgi:hypothetical protein
MAMVGNSGFKSIVYTVTSVTAVGLLDMGVTLEDIKEADSIHISYIGNSNSPTLYYWYSLENNLPKIPVGGSNPEGHPFYALSEKIIRGKRNIYNFRIISQNNSGKIVITLSSFGRGNI